jgi:CubicO group peptidase (beta-lactamase class C family)
MTSAGFGTPGSDNTRDQYMPDPPYTVPQGHHSPDDPAEPNQPIGMGALTDNPLVIGPAGTAHMNVSDMAQHLLVHMGNGAKLRTVHLSRETLDTLHQKQVDIETASGPVGYAFGWGIRVSDPYLGHPVLTHNGSNGSWLATMWIDTQLGRAVAVLNNQGGNPSEKANLEVIEQLIKMP